MRRVVAVGAVAGDHPVGLHAEHAVGRLDVSTASDDPSAWLHRQQLVLPAQVDEIGCSCAGSSTSISSR
jgi:hypothetical protein